MIRAVASVTKTRGKCKFEETLKIGSSTSKWPRCFLLRLQNENNLSLAGRSASLPLPSLFFPVIFQATGLREFKTSLHKCKNRVLSLSASIFQQISTPVEQADNTQTANFCCLDFLRCIKNCKKKKNRHVPKICLFCKQIIFLKTFVCRSRY